MPADRPAGTFQPEVQKAGIFGAFGARLEVRRRPIVTGRTNMHKARFLDLEPR